MEMEIAGIEPASMGLESIMLPLHQISKKNKIGEDTPIALHMERIFDFQQYRYSHHL